MPGFSCAVASCMSNSENSKKKHGEKISFHSFPANKKLQEEWVEKCHREDFDPENKRICSKHFLNEDYEDAMQAKIMGVTPKRLKKQAVPSIINPLPGFKLSSERTEEVKREQKEEHVENAKKILDKSQISESMISTSKTVQDLPGSSSECDHDKLQRMYDDLLAEHNEAKKQIEKYKAELEESNLTNWVLQKDIEKLKRKINCFVSF